MDTYELIKMLNQIGNLANTLDNIGIGVKTLTHDKHSSRDALKIELSQFLLYISGKRHHFTDTEVLLVDIVLGEEYTSYQLGKLDRIIDDSNPGKSMILLAFVIGDQVLNQKNGTRSAQTAKALIKLFESFGSVMAAIEGNSESVARYVKYINGMKAYVAEKL